MSSVVIWSQVWLFELSVEFLTANCKWQLAVGSGLFLVGHSDCSLFWVTFLFRNVGQRYLIGWIVPLLTSYWLKSQWLKTSLVEISIKNNLSEPNWGPKKSDWLNSGSPEILFVETAMAKNLIARIPDCHQAITQHEKRDFNVFYKECFFDPADIQASKQTIYCCKTLLYEKENIHKVSWQNTLLLKNGEIYNRWVPSGWLSFITLGCLYCDSNISTKGRF